MVRRLGHRSKGYRNSRVQAIQTTCFRLRSCRGRNGTYCNCPSYRSQATSTVGLFSWCGNRLSRGPKRLCVVASVPPPSCNTFFHQDTDRTSRCSPPNRLVEVSKRPILDREERHWQDGSHDSGIDHRIEACRLHRSGSRWCQGL